MDLAHIAESNYLSEGSLNRVTRHKLTQLLLCVYGVCVGCGWGDLKNAMRFIIELESNTFPPYP